MLGRSLAVTLRAAEQVIARHVQARHAPRVLWCGLDEPSEEFALRCAALQNAGVHRILAAIPHGYAAPDGVRPVELPIKLFRLLHPDVKTRYRVGSGGRGSAKSHSFATALVLRLMVSRLRALCAREIQRSLRESVHHLLSDKIEKLGLNDCFEINDREIRCTVTDAEIIFTGLATNPQTLRSLEGINIVWIEESEGVSAESFEILIPTIREKDSEIWLSLNPDDANAPAQEFVDSPRPDVQHVHVTYEDNPWFPPELEAERAYLQSVDPDAYAHVWLGHTRTHSDAQVFKGKYSIEEFTPDPQALAPEQPGPRPPRDFGRPLINFRDDDGPRKLWEGPYQGADFGFAVDPTASVRCWISRKCLYIEYEAYAIGCDIDRTPDLFDQIPNARLYVMRADNARPETISYLQQNGYPKITPCTKGKGSVEDGVSFIRSFERVVIHPRCTHTADEFRLYSYRVDRLTGDVMPDLVDKHNHVIDGIRYALEPALKQRRNARIVPLRL